MENIVTADNNQNEFRKKLEKKYAYLICSILFIGLFTPSLLSLCRKLSVSVKFQSFIFAAILLILGFLYIKIKKIKNLIQLMNQQIMNQQIMNQQIIKQQSPIKSVLMTEVNSEINFAVNSVVTSTDLPKYENKKQTG